MNPLILNSSSMHFCVYGLGLTGKSVINYFRRKKFSDYQVWDDNRNIRKKEKKIFSKYLDITDYIILSPGISLRKAKLKKKLIKNKHKIITDIDLFYLLNPEVKTMVITGTNGKSTTCKILEHILKKNKINAVLGGNIGKPVLDINLKTKPLVIIEASSFQLAYSQFIKPYYASILNITNDHLDWHGSSRKYVNSKFKIFSHQKKNNFAFLNDKTLAKKFKKNNYKSKLQIINSKKYESIKKKIKNDYLKLDVNTENMTYIYAFSKIFKIKEKSFIKSLKSFKGLEHRHEVVLKKNNKTFINDSKATSFQSSKFALKNNKNIFWIVGGLPKVNDKIELSLLKKNIIKSYIIGKHMKVFGRYLKKQVNLELCGTLKKAITSIAEDTKNLKGKHITILFSPASASYDQFNNFEDRGNTFKKLIKNFAKENLF